MVCYMCVYYYHVIITFCYKVSKIQEKKNVKLVIVQVFDWLSGHWCIILFMNECGCVRQ